MSASKRAALLGIAVGLAYVALRTVVLESLSTAGPPTHERLVVQTFGAAVASLVVVPGVPLVAAWRFDLAPPADWRGVAAGVLAGTWVAAVVGEPVLTSLQVGVPLSLTLKGWLVGTYLTNGLGPAVNAAAGALAGLLLADRAP